MRVHPISLALRYLRGQRSFGFAPFHGKAPFASNRQAVAVLKRFTVQDFGTDAAAWGERLRRHRRVYRHHTP